MASSSFLVCSAFATTGLSLGALFGAAVEIPLDLKCSISSIGLFHAMRFAGCQCGSDKASHGSFGNSVKLQPVKNHSSCSKTACVTATPLKIAPSRVAFPQP